VDAHDRDQMRSVLVQWFRSFDRDKPELVDDCLTTDGRMHGDGVIIRGLGAILPDGNGALKFSDACATTHVMGRCDIRLDGDAERQHHCWRFETDASIARDLSERHEIPSL
jgi:hypothetical protein